MRIPSLPLILLVAASIALPAFGQQAIPLPDTQFMPQDPDIRKLQQELLQVLQGAQKPAPERVPEAQAAPRKDKSRDAKRNLRSEKRGNELQDRARVLAEEIGQRALSRLMQVIQQNMGPMQEIEWDTVPLEATDSKGHVIEIPMSVQLRPLRMLSIPSNTMKTNYVLGEDNLALTLYDSLPRSVEPEDTAVFERAYVGEDARAVETEAKLLVSLKGGEWVEPTAGLPVANAVAVRGLDLDEGLKPNGNTTYDDTLYLVVSEPGQEVEAYEYRMTTESSSTKRGVGRLDSKQMWYVRGLHRGKDPAYRLKGSVAEGTRAGLEGTYQIVGANIHSAYSRRTIDSETPLSPNVSLGCQVIAARKPEFERSMVKMLDAKGIKEFPYTIVDGEELAILDTALAERHRQSILVHGVPRPKAEVAALP